jgi:hypothetical protein
MKLLNLSILISAIALIVCVVLFVMEMGWV